MGSNGLYQTERLEAGLTTMVVGVDQTGQLSDSNSEVSADESVVTNRSNLTASGETENNRNEKKITTTTTVAFIDFLGVGGN